MPQPSALCANTDQQWHEYKDLISNLYIDQNKTLNEIQQLMLTHFGFHATKSQYERYFKLLGLRKNRRSAEWRIIGREIAKREHLGKESQVIVDGVPLSNAKVRREMSRYTRPAIAGPAQAEQAAPSAYNQTISNTDLMSSSHFGISVSTPPDSNEAQVFSVLPYSRFIGLLLNQVETWSSHVRDRRYNGYSLLAGMREELVLEYNKFRRSSEAVMISGWLGMEYEEDRSQEPHTSLKIPHGHGKLHRLASKLDEVDPQIAARGSLSGAHGLAYIRILVYLISNNLACHSEHLVRRIFDLVTREERRWLINSIISIPGPSTDSLLQKCLSYMIEVRDKDCLRILLAHGLSPNDKTSSGQFNETSLLLRAISTGDLDVVHELVAAGADIDSNGCCHLPTTDPDGCECSPVDGRPLIYAIDQGHFHIARYLIENGADPNGTDNFDRMAAVHYAAQEQSLETIELLLERGADVGYEDLEGSDCLWHAVPSKWRSCTDSDIEIEFDHLKSVIDLLLQWGADINHVTDQDVKNGVTVIKKAAQLGHQGLIEFLITRGAEMTLDIIYRAIDSGNVSFVHWIIEEAAQYDAGNENEILGDGTLLVAAIEAGQVSVVEALLNVGASVDSEDSRDTKSATPLQAACAGGYTDLVRELLSRSADVNARPFTTEHLYSCRDSLHQPGSYTALSVAASMGHLEVVEILLQANAQVNYRRLSISALFRAIDGGHKATVKRLLKAGAKPSCWHSKHDALMLSAAIASEDEDIIALVLDTEIELDPMLRSRVKGCQTPLVTAIQKRNTKMLTHLLRSGADVNNPSSRLYGVTALQAAVQTEDLALVEYILAAGADPHDATALITAAGDASDLRIVCSLLGAHLRRYGGFRTGFGGLALRVSIAKRLTSIVRQLLHLGVDPNAMVMPIEKHAGGFRWYWSRMEHPLVLAVPVRHDESLELLSEILNFKGDLNAVKCSLHSHGEAALSRAVEHGREDAVKMLLVAGVVPRDTAPDPNERSILQTAALRGHLSIVKLLLDNGCSADDEAAPCAGMTALQAAAIGGHIGIARLLLSKGAEVNAPGSKEEGRSALEGAAEHGRIDMLQLLINSGAEIHGRGQVQYQRAIDFATRNRMFAARKMLEQIHESTMPLPSHDNTFVASQDQCPASPMTSDSMQTQAGGLAEIFDAFLDPARYAAVS